MGTSERRLEILKYLCQKRYATMRELAELFGVSIKTIQRDISALEGIFHLPIIVKQGRHNGGIYVIGDYSFDRMYMTPKEIDLLQRIAKQMHSSFDKEDVSLLLHIIDTYRKPSDDHFNMDTTCPH